MTRKPRWQLHIGDAAPLPVSVVVEVDVPKRCLFIDELKDGTLRVNYSRAFAAEVEALGIVRLVRDAARE